MKKKNSAPSPKARGAKTRRKALRVYLYSHTLGEAYTRDVPILAEFTQFGERFAVTPTILPGGNISTASYSVTHKNTGAKVWMSDESIPGVIALVKTKLKEAGKAKLLKGARICARENRRRQKLVREAEASRSRKAKGTK